MDADDLARPKRLEQQVTYLERHPEICVLGTAVTCIDEQGSPLPLSLDTGPTEPSAIRIELAKRNPLAHPTVVFRRAEILALGGYRPFFAQAEDYDLWLRVAERHDLAMLPEPLLLYRLHGSQVSWRRIEQRILSELGAVACAHARQLGRPDGGDGDVPIDRPRLLSMGFAEGELSAEIAKRAAGSAYDGVRFGQLASAREALTLAWRQRPISARLRLTIIRVGIQLLLARLADRAADHSLLLQRSFGRPPSRRSGETGLQ